MLEIQLNDIEINLAYDYYQHIFPNLILWHLSFINLKMIKKLFYLEKLSVKKSIL